MTTNAAPAAAPAAGAVPATPAPVVPEGGKTAAPTGTPATPAKPGAAAVVPPEAAKEPAAPAPKALEDLTPAEVDALSKADPQWGKRYATWQRATRASREREVSLTTKEKELETRAAKVAELESLAKEFEDDPFAAMQKRGIDTKKAVERWLNDGKPTPEHEAETQKQRLERSRRKPPSGRAREQGEVAASRRSRTRHREGGRRGRRRLRARQALRKAASVFELMRRAYVEGLPEHGMPAKTELPIAKAAEMVETLLEAKARELQERLSKAPKLGIAASAPVIPETPKSTDTRAPSDLQTPPTQPSARKVTRPAPVGRDVKKIEKKLSPEEFREASMARALKKFGG
jgi:hypothetical protein